MHARSFAHAATAGALLFAIANGTPTLAQPLPPYPDERPQWKENTAPDSAARDAWLAECRRRSGATDNGLGGAVIGGVVGGVIGNRVAGHGHRTVGTVAGAAVGAVAGAAIDKAEDQSRVRDYCQSYLDDYYAHAAAAPGYGAGYGYLGYGYPGYGYAAAYPVYAVQPVMMAPPRAHCRQVVTYEYVDVPVRRRHIYRAVPDKRIRLIPDKRVPDKRVPAK